MAQALIRWGPLLLLLSLIAALMGRSVWLWRVSAHSPYAFASRDTAHDYIGSIFLRAFGVMFMFFLFRSFAPDSEPDFGRVEWLAGEAIRLAGLGLALASVVLVVAAQLEMGRSWHIGIPEGGCPKLVKSGPFSVSRNPVLLGIIGVAIGLFLASPTAITLMALTATWFGIQVQVRLEEQYLRDRFGAEYTAYCRRVRRWI